MKTVKALFKSEFILAVRDMNTLFFGVGFSVVLAIIIGIVTGDKPAADGAEYNFLAQSFGAIVSIGIAATGLMGIPITISDYRQKKILRRFFVTPVSPALLLFVQFAVNFIISLISLILVYVTCTLFFGFRLYGSVLLFLLSYFLVLLSMYSVGMMVASVSPNSKTANLLCCIIYFPMLLLSGATLPYEIMPSFLQKITDFLPLTQGIKLLKAATLGMPLDNVILSVMVMILLAIICIILSFRFFRWE